jgi:tetratricopeptide (TPR) repeat protein
MNETDQLETLQALTEVARERELPRRGLRLARVRVSPSSYLAAASVLTFGSALLLRSERDVLALAAVAIAWLIIPVLALTDRIEFDGQWLTRRGPAPFFLGLIAGRQKELSLADFEKVDTQAVRTLRRGGRVRYRYRTLIVGRNAEFAFASGGRSYRQMVRQLFPLIPPDKLDLRTIELRDYLCEPKPLNQDVKTLQLASAAVLDDATLEFRLGGRKQARPEVSEMRSEMSDVRSEISNLRSEATPDGSEDPELNRSEDPGPHSNETAATGVSAIDGERAILLGQVGNKLRIAGRLNEAREAFRRALIVTPADGRLLFDFARLLRSQASSLRDAKLLSRARAALRLSAMRAEKEPTLLALVGESFLEWGETVRAQSSFQKALELQPENFRARMGLANLALREGKLAHVIHQYRDAAHAARDKALIRHAGREAAYYARLNEDDDYLTVELRRINWLQHSLKVRRLAARVTNASILVALVVPYFDAGVAGLCWSLASSSLIAWISSLLAIKLLARRRTPRLETRSA